ncbi:MAG: hypothetical protein ACREQY_08350 [Candidatus Binatia bacterium]
MGASIFSRGATFTLVKPEGLARHNILDHPEVYPEVDAVRTRLGGWTPRADGVRAPRRRERPTRLPP